MAMLTPGEYDLKKNKNVAHDRKSMIFVKLTDSAHRALTDYFRNMDKCDSPLIEFNQFEGRILIPSNPKTNTDTDKRMAQFKFNVTSNVAMEGTQGLLECVQHIRGTKQLIKYGQLTRRLRIHANEDVYETTRNRMVAIDSQQRQNSTKQLDWHSAHFNGKARIERLASMGSQQLTTKPNVKPNSQPINKPEEPKSASSAVPPSVIRSKGRQNNNLILHKINPAACIIRKPLKERIIHLLALKPYTKLELYDALKKDGIRDCDKPYYVDTLAAVSTVRDNLHHLSKNTWNDVQEDWLFYTELEKQQIKKNKTRNLTSPSNGYVESNLSPTNPNQSSPSNSPLKSETRSSPYKRPAFVNGTADVSIAKRPRVSLFTPPEPQQPTKPSPSAENAHQTQNRLNLSSPPEKIAPNLAASTDRAAAALKNSIRLPLESRSNSQQQQPSEQQPSRKIPTVVLSSPEVTSTSNGNDGEITRKINASPDSDETDSNFKPFRQPPPSTLRPPRLHERRFVNEKPKYMKEYVTITSMDQRRKYKADFNEIFKEYQRVHEEVDSISNTFAQLGESLRQHRKGTPKYSKIESEIFKKYYALKSSEKFQAAKRRFDYLHEKLSHIKNLVHEYDQNMLT